MYTVWYFQVLPWSTQFKYEKSSIWPVDRTLSGATTSVDLGAMALKGYSAIPKTPALLKPHFQFFSIISRTLVGGVLTLSRDTVGVFYNHRKLGKGWSEKIIKLGNSQGGITNRIRKKNCKKKIKPLFIKCLSYIPWIC